MSSQTFILTFLLFSLLTGLLLIGELPLVNSAAIVFGLGYTCLLALSLFTRIRQQDLTEEIEAKLTRELHKGNQSDAILASMEEGVLAVDSEGKILIMNRAARNLLQINHHLQNKPRIQDVIQVSEFEYLIKRVLTSRHPFEGEISLTDPDNSILQVKGSPLRDASGRNIGAVVVFHDITQLRKLETIRRDFVANVSHELKTPITSIKGFVETIMDGAIENRNDTDRFLQIISKQADRLVAIIEDLLSLSRLEQEDEAETIIKESTEARALLERSYQACMVRAAEKSITIVREASEDLYFEANPQLLEQAIVNLITNAIKYSSENGKVLVEVSNENNNITIKVQDFGLGIASEHLPRLFERFYRVDKARSRNRGGTGLGLAIVKHIAQVHGGHVSVDSTSGHGSTFYIHLPRARMENDTQMTVNV